MNSNKQPKKVTCSMKVSNTLLGLLIAGVTSIDLANATVLCSQKSSISSADDQISDNNSAGSGVAFEPPAKCLSRVIDNQPKIDSDLWLREITNIFLPGTLISGFWQQLLFSKPVTPSCVSSSPKLLDLEPGNIQSLRAQSFGTHSPEHNLSQYSTPRAPLPKFPQLSRSNLMVSFPQDNSSFVPQNTQLANPAPETTRIASPFGWRRRPYSNQLQFHQGIDYGAPFGSPIVAVGNGIVTQVASGCLDFGSLTCGGQLGNWIEIDHGHGQIATYGHLKSSSITVKAGMKVSKNQVLAQVGSSGWSTGAHLDFRLKVNGQPKNPARYLAAFNSQNVNPIKN